MRPSASGLKVRRSERSAKEATKVVGRVLPPSPDPTALSDAPEPSSPSPPLSDPSSSSAVREARAWRARVVTRRSLPPSLRPPRPRPRPRLRARPRPRTRTGDSGGSYSLSLSVVDGESRARGRRAPRPRPRPRDPRLAVLLVFSARSASWRAKRASRSLWVYARARWVAPTVPRRCSFLVSSSSRRSLASFSRMATLAEALRRAEVRWTIRVRAVVGERSGRERIDSDFSRRRRRFLGDVSGDESGGGATRAYP